MRRGVQSTTPYMIIITRGGRRGRFASVVTQIRAWVLRNDKKSCFLHCHYLFRPMGGLAKLWTLAPPVLEFRNIFQKLAGEIAVFHHKQLRRVGGSRRKNIVREISRRFLKRGMTKLSIIHTFLLPAGDQQKPFKKVSAARGRSIFIFQVTNCLVPLPLLSFCKIYNIWKIYFLLLKTASYSQKNVRVQGPKGKGIFSFLLPVNTNLME